MPVQTPPKPTRESTVNDLSWKMSNIETKIRINEQNIINEGKRIQLVNKNFLDLKKEVRDRLDKISKDVQEIKKSVKKHELKLKKPKTKVSSVNLFKPDITKDEAGKVLDDILKKIKTKKVSNA